MPATFTPCSPKQAAFLATLVKDRVCPPIIHQAARDAAFGGFSAHEASAAIEMALRCPKAATNADPASQGYYLVKGEVYAVVVGKESGKLYAKKLLLAGGKGSWVYAPGAVYHLTLEQKLTLAQAQEMGHMFGVCMVCGRTLTDQKSVSAGIGPVCAKKL
jgi:hypothetical protein